MVAILPTSYRGLQSEKVSRHSGDTLRTLLGHSRARGPKGPGDTPWDTQSDTPVFGDALGDTRARRARETPVVGRRDRDHKIDLLRSLWGLGGILSCPRTSQKLPFCGHLHTQLILGLEDSFFSGNAEGSRNPWVVKFHGRPGY